MFPIQPQIDYHVACFLQSRCHPTHHPHCLISITTGHHRVESWPHPPLYSPMHHLFSPSSHLFLSSPSLFFCNSPESPSLFLFSSSLFVLLFHVFIHAALDVFQSLPPFLFLHHNHPSLDFSLVASIALVFRYLLSPLPSVLYFVFGVECSHLMAFGGLCMTFKCSLFTL